jgi:glucose-6-phosphate 1-dehydrogenase
MASSNRFGIAAHIIDHVQITVAETVEVEQRGSYPDHAGSAGHDPQPHPATGQLLTAMEPRFRFRRRVLVSDEQSKKMLHAIESCRPRRSADQGRSRAAGSVRSAEAAPAIAKSSLSVLDVEIAGGKAKIRPQAGRR